MLISNLSTLSSNASYMYSLIRHKYTYLLYVATCTYRATACMLRAHLPLQVRGYVRRREEKEVKVGMLA